jgi:hypothetical protein
MSCHWEDMFPGKKFFGGLEHKRNGELFKGKCKN